MRPLLPMLALVVGLTACGGSSSTAKPTSVAQVQATPTAPPLPRATKAVAAPTAVATTVPRVVVSGTYASFVATLCHALVTRDTTTLASSLPYFQYNSGLRYGQLGDGEGATGDPSLFNTWLNGASVRCRFYTPDQAGHGTLLTDGWTQSGGWSLIEMDIYNGTWKINDFTFGDRGALYQAMQTSHPILSYRGR